MLFEQPFVGTICWTNKLYKKNWPWHKNQNNRERK